MTSLKPWNASLQTTLSTLSSQTAPRVVIVGIGHTLRGDDAAGTAVANRLQSLSNERVLVVNAEHAPENITGPVRRFQPDLVLLVDMAQMDLPPGSVRLIPWQATTGLSASSHTLPLHMLARYFVETADCDVALLGIQPARTGLGEAMSAEVEAAVNAVVAGLTAVVFDRRQAEQANQPTHRAY